MLGFVSPVAAGWSFCGDGGVVGKSGRRKRACGRLRAACLECESLCESARRESALKLVPDGGSGEALITRLFTSTDAALSALPSSPSALSGVIVVSLLMQQLLPFVVLATNEQLSAHRNHGGASGRHRRR